MIEVLEAKSSSSKEYLRGEENRFYPPVQIDTAGTGVVSQAGAVPVVEAVLGCRVLIVACH